MKTAQYLDAAKKKLRIESDYALAKHLEISPNRLSNWRVGPSLPDTEMAVRLAGILGLDELKVVADIELERGTNDEFWARIARRVAVLSLVAIGAGAVLAPSPSQAASAAPASGACVLCQMSHRRRLEALVRLLAHYLWPMPQLRP